VETGESRRDESHEFYGLKALITLEQVITLVVEKKNDLNEQNFDGEANWSGVVNFHCMQMSFVLSMHGVTIEMTRHVHHVSLIFVHLLPCEQSSFDIPRRRICSQGMHLHTRSSSNTI